MPRTQASRKSTGGIPTTKSRAPQATIANRRQTLPVTIRDDADMPVPSSQRSEPDSQDIRTAQKRVKDAFREMSDRCETIRSDIQTADDEMIAKVQQIADASVKKDAAFVKGTRRFLDQIVASANITGDATQSQIARLKKQNDEVLRRCDDLERRYSEACSLVEASHQQDRDFGARWHEDAEVLVDTLKAGARAVQREIAAMTETSAASGIDARPTSLADEEAKTIKALGLNTTAVAMGLRQTMADGHAGLKKITRNLPLDGDAVMTG